MKKYLIYTLIFFNSVPIFAQDQSLLWTISKKRSKKVSYLYGTIHIKDQRAYNVSDCLLPAIEKADVLALELDMDNIDPMAFHDLMFLPQDQTLEDIYKPDDFRLIDSVFYEVTGIPLSPIFVRMQPFSISITLTEFFFNNDYSLPLDLYLNEYAKTKKVETVGLEKIEDQLTIIADYDPQFLLDELNDLDGSKEEIEQLMILYDEGNADGIVDMMIRDIQTVEDSVYLEKILFARNETMTDRIIEIIDQQEAVIAIGAGHFGGERGVIHSLRNKGYIVEALICEEHLIEELSED